MMKKLYLTVAIALLVAIASVAEPVTKGAARQIASLFLQSQGKSVKSEPARTQRMRGKAAAGTEQTAAYYVFNTSDNDGFVIVSGDDRTEQILGYSMNGAFDEEDMPENVKAWLQTYADQIESMGNGPRRAPSHTYHDAIPVIIKTLWGQDTPYNNACPPYIIGGNTYSSVTGCVATAIAQIMYHYKYPTAVTTAIPAYSYEDQYGSHSVLSTGRASINTYSVYIHVRILLGSSTYPCLSVRETAVFQIREQAT